MKKVYCPVNEWDCPFWQKDGTCSLESPIEDCDDYAFYVADDVEGDDE